MNKEDHSRIVLDQNIWRAWQEFSAKHPRLGGRAPEQNLQHVMCGVMKMAGPQWIGFLQQQSEPAVLTLELLDQPELREEILLSLAVFNEPT